MQFPYQSQPPGVPGQPQLAKKKNYKLDLLVVWKPTLRVITIVFLTLGFATLGAVTLRNSKADTPEPSKFAIVSNLDDLAASPQDLVGGGTISAVDGGTKGRALQFSGPANQSAIGPNGAYQQAELLSNLKFIKGDTQWFGFELQVDGSKAGTSAGRQSIWRLQSSVVASAMDKAQEVTKPKLGMSVNSTREGLVLEAGNDRVAIGPTPYGTWTRLAIGIKVVAGSEAWVEVWRDGIKVIPHQVLPDGAIAQGSDYADLVLGIYRTPQDWKLEYTIAHLTAGASRESVQ